MPKQIMAKNKTYNRLIHTGRWLQLRKIVLNEHPLCQICEKEGRISAAVEVHHIVPCEVASNADEMARLMYDRHNLVAVCHNCHVELHQQMGKGGKEERLKRTTNKVKDFAVKFFG